MVKETSKDNWTMTYTQATVPGDEDTYQLSCLDTNFNEREMAVKVPCSGKVMTGDLYVNVRAEEAVLTNPVITLTPTLTYSKPTATGSTNYTVEAAGSADGTIDIDTKGWIENTIPVSATINSTTPPSIIVPTAEKTFTPKAGSITYEARQGGDGELLRKVTVEAVNTASVSTQVSTATVRMHGSGDYTTFQLNLRNQIAIGLDQYNEVGFYIAENPASNTRFIPATTSMPTITLGGQTVYGYNDNVIGSVLGCTGVTFTAEGGNPPIVKQYWDLYVWSGQTIILGTTPTVVKIEHNLGKIEQTITGAITPRANCTITVYYNQKNTAGSNENMNIITFDNTYMNRTI